MLLCVTCVGCSHSLHPGWSCSLCCSTDPRVGRQGRVVKLAFCRTACATLFVFSTLKKTVGAATSLWTLLYVCSPARLSLSLSLSLHDGLWLSVFFLGSIGGYYCYDIVGLFLQRRHDCLFQNNSDSICCSNHSLSISCSSLDWHANKVETITDRDIYGICSSDWKLMSQSTHASLTPDLMFMTSSVIILC